MVEESKETPIETPSAEKPTPQVDVQAVLQEKARLETELAQAIKGLSSAHQTVQQRDRELKKYQAIDQDLAELKEMVALGMSNRSSDGISDDGASVLKSLEQKHRTRREEASRQEMEAGRLSYNARADAIWARAQTAITDPDVLEDIKDLLSNSLAGMAERQVAKAEKAIKAAPKQSDADHQKEIEEAARRILEESGQLTKTGVSQAGSSKGKVWTTSEIAAMDTQTYIQTFPNGGADIMRLMSEGKVQDK